MALPDPLADLSDRSREVFRRVVEAYLVTGEPVGSRTLTRSMSEKVSAATIRNVMQDLEFLGLLGSPHVSAGRVPTQAGLRMFVDGLMEVTSLDDSDRDRLNETLGGENTDVASMLDRVGQTLSGITHGASLVMTPKQEAPIRHIEFVSLAPDRALAVLVFKDGRVENRVFSPPPGQTPAAMREASNFLSRIGEGRTLSQLRHAINAEISRYRSELDTLAQTMVAAGIAAWDKDEGSDGRLIVRGQANLLDAGVDPAELERLRTLLDDLERKKDIAEFLQLAEDAEGVRIFIGSENKLFSLSGSALVVSPYMNADRKIVGVIGVIGPTRLNYGRIVPVVNYTAELVGRMLSDRG
jgi:heat-inducible transcriptional repressor